MRGRAAGWWGLTFCVLLLVSAAMATVPGRDDPVATVRAFYVDHTGVVVAAQVLGLLAAAALVPFLLGLGGAARTPRPLLVAGLGVVAAAVITAVPVLTLCAVAATGGARTLHDLAAASDLVDVLLFAAIAVFAGVVSMLASPLLRGLAAVVALLAGARAVLLVAGSGSLELQAPLGFVVLVLVLSAALLRGREVVRGPARSPADA